MPARSCTAPCRSSGSPSMPDAYDLEALVRATRPAPDPGWAARLDGRAARFEDPAPWYRRPLALARGNLVPLGALASLIVLVGAVALLAGARDQNDGASFNSGGGSASSDEAAAPAASAKAP